MNTRMTGLCLTVAAMVLIAAVPARSAEPRTVETVGAIEAVTVYRGQALVTRVLPIDGPAGSVELVVGELPERILSDSLYASSNAATVRAVRYRAKAVEQEPRDDLRKLDEQIEEVQRSIRKNEAGLAVLQYRLESLNRMDLFTSTKTTENLDKGTLDADSAVKLAEFLAQQRMAVSDKTFELGEEGRSLKEKLNLLQRQRSELAARVSRTAREAVLTLDKTKAGAGAVRLSCLVLGASWSPMYNLRADGGGDAVHVEYNAQIGQTSGEDWNGVSLTLSTASPAMVADAPILAPLWVTLSQQAAQPGGPGDVSRSQMELRRNMRQAVQQRGAPAKAGEALGEQDWAANEWAGRSQFLDLVARKDVLLVGRETRPTDEALSVNYQLPGPISLPSRSDQQLVQIAALKLPAEFYYVAVPLLTPYVYQQTRVSNTSEVALLAGPVSAYLDGQFMGKGAIPMVAKGQRFLVGFGVDSQLRSARELADKTDKIQGGNRELSFTYRLLLENYKAKPVRMRVMDRLPDPKGSDIRVTLVTSGDPISEDKVYQRTLRKEGILQWEVEVPAQAAGESARTIEYTFRMEFDRNLNLAEPGAPEMEKQRLEFKHQLDSWLLQ